MSRDKRNVKQQSARISSRIPEGKFFFQKMIVPILLVMAIGTAGLILFALAVLLGYVNF